MYSVSILIYTLTALSVLKFSVKELTLCHKLCFSKPYIFGFQCRRYFKLWILLDKLISLKYQIYTTLGSKDKGIVNSEFVAKTQFLFKKILFKRQCSRKMKGRKKMISPVVENTFTLLDPNCFCFFLIITINLH